MPICCKCKPAPFITAHTNDTRTHTRPHSHANIRIKSNMKAPACCFHVCLDTRLIHLCVVSPSLFDTVSFCKVFRWYAMLKVLLIYSITSIIFVVFSFSIYSFVFFLDIWCLTEFFSILVCAAVRWFFYLAGEWPCFRAYVVVGSKHKS